MGRFTYDFMTRALCCLLIFTFWSLHQWACFLFNFWALFVPFHIAYGACFGALPIYGRLQALIIGNLIATTATARDCYYEWWYWYFTWCSGVIWIWWYSRIQDYTNLIIFRAQIPLRSRNRGQWHDRTPIVNSQVFTSWSDVIVINFIPNPIE